MRELRLPPVRASRDCFMSMNRQQSEYKMALCINGHSAPDRMYRLFNGSQLVLRPEPAPHDVGQHVWFSPLLRPMLHFIPLRADMADLHDKAQWLMDRPEIQRRMLHACSELPLDRMKEWWKIALDHQ